MTGATPYVVERIAPRAANYLGRLPRNQQEAVAEAIHYLCNTSPFHHTNPTTIKELKGKYKGQWRYRIGKIRIVYSVDQNSRAIRIAAIDNRGDVY